MHVVIMGCGRVGSALAQSLSHLPQQAVSRVTIDLAPSARIAVRAVDGPPQLIFAGHLISGDHDSRSRWVNRFDEAALARFISPVKR